jgi:hypothetical protein
MHNGFSRFHRMSALICIVGRCDISCHVNYKKNAAIKLANDILHWRKLEDVENVPNIDHTHFVMVFLVRILEVAWWDCLSINFVPIKLCIGWWTQWCQGKAMLKACAVERNTARCEASYWLVHVFPSQTLLQRKAIMLGILLLCHFLDVIF